MHQNESPEPQTLRPVVVDETHRTPFLQELARITNPFTAADFCLTFAERHGLMNQFALCNFDAVRFYTLLKATDDPKKFSQLLEDLPK